MASNRPPRKDKPFDLITRGSKRSTPLGSTIFTGLRALDPLLQYSILAHGLGSSLLHKVGLNTLPPGLPTATGTFIDKLGLSPYRLVLLSMAVGSSVKQIYWLLSISQEEFPPGAAIPVAVFNTLFNSINSLAFTCALTSASLSNDGTFPQIPLIIGSVLYAVGITIETVSEIQRRNFKADPKNEGKCYTSGLWQYARHINYFGYSVWRAGYSMTAAGFTWGIVVGGMQLWDFSSRAIEVLDEYCGERYGEQWVEFKRKTPSRLIPGLW